MAVTLSTASSSSPNPGRDQVDGGGVHRRQRRRLKPCACYWFPPLAGPRVCVSPTQTPHTDTHTYIHSQTSLFSLGLTFSLFSYPILPYPARPYIYLLRVLTFSIHMLLPGDLLPPPPPPSPPTSSISNQSDFPFAIRRHEMGEVGCNWASLIIHFHSVGIIKIEHWWRR